MVLDLVAPMRNVPRAIARTINVKNLASLIPVNPASVSQEWFVTLSAKLVDLLIALTAKVTNILILAHVVLKNPREGAVSLMRNASMTSLVSMEPALNSSLLLIANSMNIGRMILVAYVKPRAHIAIMMSNVRKGFIALTGYVRL